MDTPTNNAFNAPRKSLGQNFLQDPNIIRKIVNALGIKPGDTVLEIGPGRGALTELLLESGCNLHLVEFDRDLAKYWQQQAEEFPQLTVHSADILDFDFDELQLEPDQRIKIVGNLPYNISSPILILLLDYVNIIERLVIMLQKEVIDRLSASEGSKQFGRLTVMVQQTFTVSALFGVPNTAFFPPPKVASAVAELIPHDQYPVNDRVVFGALVKMAFAQRRKTLRNNFKLSDHWPLLESTDFDFARRAETVSVEEFVEWSNRISAS